MDRNGNFNIKVGFSEPRRDGGSNAQLANIIEYGKSGSACKAVFEACQICIQEASIEAMKQAFETEVEKL